MMAARNAGEWAGWRLRVVAIATLFVWWLPSGVLGQAVAEGEGSGALLAEGEGSGAPVEPEADDIELALAPDAELQGDVNPEGVPWPQLIYQYGIGGLFFLITLLLCFQRGAGDPHVPTDRRTLVYCIVGFFGYLGVHTIWILLAAG